MEQKKIYRVGDIIAIIKEKEMKEIKALSETKAAIKQTIRDLMDGLVVLEEKNMVEQAEWWERMKKKYNTPSLTDLRRNQYLGDNLILKLSHETRELYIGIETRK